MHEKALLRLYPDHALLARVYTPHCWSSSPVQHPTDSKTRALSPSAPRLSGCSSPLRAHLAKSAIPMTVPISLALRSAEMSSSAECKKSTLDASTAASSCLPVGGKKLATGVVE